MKYWWVNHGQTYEFEVPGNFLWSPKRQIDGSRSQYYDFMMEIQPGDYVFSYSNKMIRALGIATTKAYTAPKPEFRTKGSNWSDTGWQVDVAFQELMSPFEPQNFLDQLEPLLPEKYSPLQSSGRAHQAYLFEISKEIFELLLSNSDVKISEFDDLKPELVKIEKLNQLHEDQIIQRVNLGPLEKENLVKSRRGQGIFRNNVQMIEKFCRVTKLRDKELLIASHIKPWKDSDDKEKIDGNNGLLLSPHIDKLFDNGLISFSDVGDLLISSKVNIEVFNLWGIDPNLNIGKFSSEQMRYLAYHRKHRFKI